MSARVQDVVVADGVALSLHGWEGERIAFLLVHGLWDGVAEKLAGRGHRVLAVDLRGHGTSSKPDQGYDITTLTSDLVAVLDAVDCPEVVVAGQSMGANIALEFAWRFPERTAGVACIDGGWIELRRRFPDWESCVAALAPPPTTGLPLAEIESMIRGRHPDWPESGIRGTLACFDHRPDGTVAPWLTLERHLALLRTLWEHRPSTRYPQLTVPVLLVPAGDESKDGERRREVEAASTALPRSEVHWISGDHDLHAQHPPEIAALLSSFSVALAVPQTADATKNRGG